MNELTEFTNTDFGTIRTIEVDNKPYFCASDVAIALGYKKPNNAISSHCRSTLKQGIATKQGNMSDMVFIPEGDVYRLIVRSKLPSAEKFESWIMDKVLPQIRMTGGYIPVVDDEPNEVFLARAVKVANDTIQHKDEIIEMQKKRISSLEVTEKDWKLLMDAKGTYSINEIGHFIGIGEYTLFEMLRNFGVLFKNDNNDNVPYEKPAHKGKLTTVAAIAPDGSAHSQTRVYPEGIAYITKILRKHKVLEVSA